MSWRDVWRVLRESVREFGEDDALSQAAAVAFYTALGLAPTVLLALAVTAVLGEGTKQAMLGQVQSMVGGEGAQGIGMVVESAERQQTSGAFAAVVGVVTVLFSASGIFAQLQTALNRIWDIKPRPDGGYWSWVRSRLLSLTQFR